ncbi:kelch-like protein 1 [Paramacrobiotus metropolitanus]|uniref:kelch-like protein 1 n=1 Tax=Paramacrobiotus metropolitanus TaxID=2943436 RepID=UPI00244601C3|nr:kelch-like protein 1 [Paramacrobiotus metropolitanus]
MNKIPILFTCVVSYSFVIRDTRIKPRIPYNKDEDDVAIVYIKREPEEIIRKLLVRVVVGKHVQYAARGAVQDLLPDAAYFQHGLTPVGNEYTVVVPDGVDPLAAHSVLLTALTPGVPLNWKATAKGLTVEQLRKAAAHFNISVEKLGLPPPKPSSSGQRANINPAPGPSSAPSGQAGSARAIDNQDDVEIFEDEDSSVDSDSDSADEDWSGCSESEDGDADPPDPNGVPTKSYEEMQDTFRSYSNTPEFLNLPFKQLLTLIGKGFLAVRSEKDVYQAVMKWCNYQRKSRCKERILAPLLAEIRWDLLIDTLEQKISTAKDPTLKILSDIKKVVKPTWRRITAEPRQRHFTETVYTFHADRHQVSLRRFDWRNNTLSATISLKGVPASSTWKEFGPVVDNKLSFRVQRGAKLQTFQYCPVSKKVRLLYDEPLATGRVGPTAYLNGLLHRWDFKNEDYDNNSTYDPVSKETVEDLQPPYELRKEAAFDCFDDKLYYCGGMPIFGQRRHSAVSMVEMYDAEPDNQYWTSLPSMRFARRCFAVKVFNGYLYATGGACNSGETFHQGIMHTCERLQLDNPEAEWERIADLEEARYNHAMFVVNGRLYVCGGSVWYGTQSTTMERYDAEKNQWDRFFDTEQNLFGAISHCATLTQCYKG